MAATPHLCSSCGLRDDDAGASRTGTITKCPTCGFNIANAVLMPSKYQDKSSRQTDRH